MKNAATNAGDAPKTGAGTRGLRIAGSLGIASLLGALATTACLAAEASGEATPGAGSGNPHVADTPGRADGPGRNNAGQNGVQNSGKPGTTPFVAGTGNAGSTTGGPDLVAPDNGAGNLRRRADRKLLIAITAQKNATSGSLPIINARTLLTPGPGPGRNAVGIAVPPGVPGDGLGHHAPGFMHPTVTGSSGFVGIGAGGTGLRPPVIHANATAPIHTVGINGSTLGHVGPGIIGGPAKIRTGVNGTSFRPK